MIPHEPVGAVRLDGALAGARRAGHRPARLNLLPYAFSIFTAQTLYSGTFATGSKKSLVSTLQLPSR
jgi:hypothetical protein